MLGKCFAIVVALLSPALALAAELTVIKPSEAAANLDKEVTVEFEVKKGRLMAEKNICFLNSEDNLKSADNFTVFIGNKGLTAFKAKSIDNPAEKYVGKKIRVTGKIKKHKDKPEIVVESPDQIKLVEDEAKPEASKSEK